MILKFGKTCCRSIGAGGLKAVEDRGLPVEPAVTYIDDGLWYERLDAPEPGG
jgi:hypothetical protein